jgi:serine/threonine protein kinase
MVRCPACRVENQGDHQFCVSCGSRLSPDVSAIERYHLEGVLGRGASSIVYQATDTETGNSVAVKALNPELLTRPGLRQRLREEARILRRLTHPNIVSVVDFIETDQAVWLVTESVEGTSLRNVLIHAYQLEPEQALSIFTGLLAGLAYAHQRGLVHGDLKPENVLVEASGTAKLADFGQAVPAGHATTGGTAAYMSPEAVRGGAIGPAADLYGVGAVLYEALTGRPPFLAANEEALRRMQLTETPAPIGGLPRAIRSLVASLLDKDPARRPPSATAALSAFESAVREAYGSQWRRRAGVATLVETTATRFPTIPAAPSPSAAPPGPGPVFEPRPSPPPTLPSARPEPERLPQRLPIWRRRWFLGSLAAITAMAGLTVGVLAAASGSKSASSHGKTAMQTPPPASQHPAPGLTPTAGAVTGATSPAAGTAPGRAPVVSAVSFSGTPGSYTLTITGSGFGPPPGTTPFTGTAPNFRIADSAQIGHGEWGYDGDANQLAYQSWTNSQIVVGGLGASPGDALVLVLWNSATGKGVSWGGDVPPVPPGPQIKSVTFSGSASDPEITITGRGFGPAPQPMPYTGTLQNFILSDWRIYPAGNGPSGTWSSGVTEAFRSWGDNKIVISGFGGVFGTYPNILKSGDPVTIQIWSPASGFDTGPQTAWAGRYQPTS